MLSLNTYGCARQAPSSNQSQHQQRNVVLPRLSLHNGTGGGLSPTPPQARGANSLTKLDMMRANAHPLYRTTAGYVAPFIIVALRSPLH